SAGSRTLYAVRWEGTSRRTGLEDGEHGAIAGSALFEGDLSVRSLGQGQDGVATLVYAIENVRSYALELGEHAMVGDGDRRLAAAALRGQEVRVEVDALGKVGSLAYRRSTDASTRELLKQLVDMMRVTLPLEEGAASWSAQEPTPNGVARVR